MYILFSMNRAKNKTIQLRVDDRLKSDFEDVVQKLGMSSSQAIYFFLNQVVRQRKIPFQISLLDQEEKKRTGKNFVSFLRKNRRKFKDPFKDQNYKEVYSQDMDKKYGF